MIRSLEIKKDRTGNVSSRFGTCPTRGTEDLRDLCRLCRSPRIVGIKSRMLKCARRVVGLG